MKGLETPKPLNPKPFNPGVYRADNLSESFSLRPYRRSSAVSELDGGCSRKGANAVRIIWLCCMFISTSIIYICIYIYVCKRTVCVYIYTYFIATSYVIMQIHVCARACIRLVATTLSLSPSLSLSVYQFYQSIHPSIQRVS